MFKFTSKFNSKKRNQVSAPIDFTKEYSDYYGIVSKEKFISFDAISNLALLVSSEASDSKVVGIYKAKVLQAYKNHRELIFKNFIISWSKTSRFGVTKLVPIVTEQESSNIMASNFFEDQKDPVLNKFLSNLNSLIWKYVTEKQAFVEVAEGIIVFVSPQTKKLKVVFSEISTGEKQ